MKPHGQLPPRVVSRPRLPAAAPLPSACTEPPGARWNERREKGPLPSLAREPGNGGQGCGPECSAQTSCHSAPGQQAGSPAPRGLIRPGCGDGIQTGRLPTTEPHFLTALEAHSLRSRCQDRGTWGRTSPRLATFQLCPHVAERGRGTLWGPVPRGAHPSPEGPPPQPNCLQGLQAPP